MENPRRNFLRTITSAAALPALMSIVESACETELGKSLVVSQDFRTHFPILKEAVNGKSLVYLDSAATTQRPRAVLDALANFYLRQNANPAKSLHRLARRSAALYEGARALIAGVRKCSSSGRDRLHRRDDRGLQSGCFVVGRCRRAIGSSSRASRGTRSVTRTQRSCMQTAKLSRLLRRFSATGISRRR